MEYFRWHFAEKFGWTLPEIDALSMADVEEYHQVFDGIAKAKAQTGARNAPKARKHGRGR
jgi:hypothetical protein